MADFDVRAKLTLDSGAAFAGLTRFGNSLQSAQHALQASNGLAGGLVGRLVGVAGAYIGLNAGIGVFKGLARGAIDYTGELEATKIGLQSVLQAVQGGTWEDAGERASGAFEKLKRAAMESTATTAEMFSIYSGIVGPIAAAGYDLDKVHQITVDTTLAASALHVDFAQASRDVTMMARGAAGMDVKLFSMLRSTGAITKSTEQWNKLDAHTRVALLGDALAKYRASGEAFGKSWKGVTSTFTDVKNEMTRALVSPAMAVFARKLDGLNQYFLAHQDEVTHRLSVYGDRIGNWIGAAWDRGARVAQWTVGHWSIVTAHIDNAMVRLQSMLPYAIPLAKAFAAYSIGSKVAAPVLGAASMGVGAAGFAAKGMAGFLGGLGLGGAGAAGAAAATGAGAAGAAGTAAAGAGAAEAAGAAGAAAVGIGAVVTGLALLATATEPVIDNWQGLKDTTQTTVEGIWESFVGMGQSIWAGIRGPVYMIGSVVTAFGSILITGLSTAFNLVTNAVTWFMDGLEPISTTIMDWVVPAFKELVRGLEDFARTAQMVTGRVTVLAASEGIVDIDRKNEWKASENQMMAGFDTARPAEAKRLKELVKQKTTVNNDFRGSHIKLEQKFEGDTDPDRVLVATMEGLTRQAEIRYSSGYAGAFTR